MASAKRPRIVLIHAVQVAMAPIEAAFRDLWPLAERVNLLEDSLSVDRGAHAELTPAMFDRFDRLGQYARDIGADGILYTCSAFGPAIEKVARDHAPLPVLKPNEAMFEAALDAGDRIGLLASFERSVPSMVAEFKELAAAKGRKAAIETVCEPRAMPALQAGNAATHNALLADAAAKLSDCDAVLLAQFSTSIAAPAVSARLSCPVLTSPGSAVLKMKSLVRI
ncbi:MAG: aspartate/glutamate racemase family protein [Hyphomicrobiaceae bacterium]